MLREALLAVLLVATPGQLCLDPVEQAVHPSAKPPSAPSSGRPACLTQCRAAGRTFDQHGAPYLQLNCREGVILVPLSSRPVPEAPRDQRRDQGAGWVHGGPPGSMVMITRCTPSGAPEPQLREGAQHDPTLHLLDRSWMFTHAPWRGWPRRALSTS